jgi:hypothetical protein
MQGEEKHSMCSEKGRRINGLDRTCVGAAIWGYVTLEKIGGTRRRGGRSKNLMTLRNIIDTGT